jgi:hypothetical protein
MSVTDDRIRETLAERAGSPSAGEMSASVPRRIRARQTGVAIAFGSAASFVVAVAVIAYSAVAPSAPRPAPTLDPAADGYTSPLENVPPRWPAIDVHDPSTAYVPQLRGADVSDGPVVLASGDVEGESFTVYAYTLGRGSLATPCIGFVGFAAPGAPTRSAPNVTTCADAVAVPEERDVGFIGSRVGDLEANFGFVSDRVDVVYVWGGGKYGMFAMPKLPALDGWNVDPFFFVPAPKAGPLEVDARVHGRDQELAHANVCRPSDVAATCHRRVVQDFPLTSPVDVPVALAPGDWPAVTYGGDFEPYVDHEVDANGVRDPGVVGDKTVIAYGTVQEAPWSLAAFNSEFAGAPSSVSPSVQLEGPSGGSGASLYETTPWEPNDLSAGYGWGSDQGFVDVSGVVSPRVAAVRLELADGTTKGLPLIDGPPGVAARFFVTFLPSRSTGRVVALDSAGAELDQACIRDSKGNPPSGMPCVD